jgi:hypothetical protein
LWNDAVSAMRITGVSNADENKRRINTLWNNAVYR